MINSYAFGKMEIDGNSYNFDLIILPGGRVKDNWYRQSGHTLTLDDLSQLTDARPELIIAGTGAYGRMALAPGLSKTLAQMGIQIRALKTAEAVDLYNQMLKEKTTAPQTLGACFHLTC